MRNYLGIRKLYPKRPFVIVTPRGARVRYGTRVVYADVPTEIYWLYVLWWIYYNAEPEENKKEILNKIKELEETIRKTLGEYSDLYVITRPIRKPGVRKPYIQLRIKWDRFIEYLDRLVAGFINEARKRDHSGVSKLVVDFYSKKIIGDYFLLAKSIGISDLTSHSQRWDFKRLLLRLGETQKTYSLLSRLENATRKLLETRSRDSLHEAQNKIPWDYLVFSHVKAGLSGLKDSLNEDVKVPAMMLHLRRYIETLVRALSYYEGLKRGEHMIEQDFSRYFYKKFYDPKNAKTYLDSKNLKRLGFSSTHAASISKVYSIASEVLHKIPPLPYRSLLEFKLFRETLRWLVETLEEAADINPPGEEHVDPWEALAQERKAAIKAVYLTRHDRGKIIWLLCESLHELFRDHLDHLYTLKGLYLLSNLLPPEKYVKNGYITEMEFIYTIEETTSKLWGINAVKLTLGLNKFQIMKEILARKLGEDRMFLGYAPEYIEKVAFYLLILVLKKVLSDQTCWKLEN